MWRLIALSLLFSPQAWAAECADRCSAKQDRCIEGCNGLEKCTRRCVASANGCHSACDADAARSQQRDDAEVASLEECTSEDGARRRCTESEKKALRAMMAKASGMFCKDSTGELVPCADQQKKLDKAASDLAKLCKKNKELCVEASPEAEGAEADAR